MFTGNEHLIVNEGRKARAGDEDTASIPSSLWVVWVYEVSILGWKSLLWFFFPLVFSFSITVEFWASGSVSGV